MKTKRTEFLSVQFPFLVVCEFMLDRTFTEKGRVGINLNAETFTGSFSLKCRNFQWKSCISRHSYLKPVQLSKPTVYPMQVGTLPNKTSPAFYFTQSFTDTYCPASNITVFVRCYREQETSFDSLSLYSRPFSCEGFIFLSL
jgi:hypothetical protein